MSRIGKKPIPLPANVKYTVQGNTVLVEGPKGKLTAMLPTGISLEKKDDTLLHHAALRGHKPIVEALLAAGMNVNATSINGFHVYYWHFQKRPDVVDFFKERDLKKLRGVPGIGIPEPTELLHLSMGRTSGSMSRPVVFGVDGGDSFAAAQASTLRLGVIDGAELIDSATGR